MLFCQTCLSILVRVAGEQVFMMIVAQPVRQPVQVLCVCMCAAKLSLASPVCFGHHNKCSQHVCRLFTSVLLVAITVMDSCCMQLPICMLKQVMPGQVRPVLQCKHTCGCDMLPCQSW